MCIRDRINHELIICGRYSCIVFLLVKISFPTAAIFWKKRNGWAVLERHVHIANLGASLPSGTTSHCSLQQNTVAMYGPLMEFVVIVQKCVLKGPTKGIE